MFISIVRDLSGQYCPHLFPFEKYAAEEQRLNIFTILGAHFETMSVQNLIFQSTEHHTAVDVEALGGQGPQGVI